MAVQNLSAVTAACLTLGFPLALAIARALPRRKAVLIILVVVPLFVGNAVRAAGWMVAFGQKGLVNAVLEASASMRPPSCTRHKRCSSASSRSTCRS